MLTSKVELIKNSIIFLNNLFEISIITKTFEIINKTFVMVRPRPSILRPIMNQG